MRTKRLAAVLLVAAGLAPLTWLRSEPAAPVLGVVTARPLSLPAPQGWPRGLTLEAAWHLVSDDPAVAGISALVALEGDRLLAFTDGGMEVAFTAPPAPLAARIAPVPPDRAIAILPDIESAIADRATGTLWLGYEQHHAIRRLDADGASASVQPVAMRGWGANSGPEAMARLADGRFVVLAERAGIGLLFPGDPVAGAVPLAFALALPEDYLPVDMAPLPDGRLLVLLRATRLALPPFASMLAIGDPAAIAEGQPWRLRELARIGGRALGENYEALAVTPAEDGALTLWLAADDNRSVLQRSLLLRLRWDFAGMAEAGTAIRPPRAPS